MLSTNICDVFAPITALNGSAGTGLRTACGACPCPESETASGVAEAPLETVSVDCVRPAAVTGLNVTAITQLPLLAARTTPAAHVVPVPEISKPLFPGITRLPRAPDAFPVFVTVTVCFSEV